MITKENLSEIVASYSGRLKATEKARLELAYSYAQKKHEGQFRDTGEPYFTHPLAVATSAAKQYEMDIDSVCAALLHDVVEDTDATIGEIESLFGASVATLVRGLTKLGKSIIKNQLHAKAENYRNFVLAISGDIRVLIIKLLDRHHNMTTLRFIKGTERRRRIANETMLVFIPLAERVGMDNIKGEMQDACFRELYPQEYNFVAEKLEAFHKSGGDRITPIVEELSKLAFKHEIKAQVYGREKSPYSIWHKMHTRNKIFDEIFDIVAFRFVVQSVDDCYKALGMIHSAYKIVPNRFKDYISMPKPNRYQSLHTTIIGMNGKRIEIQIRSDEMDRVAQYGYAAHYLYKQGVFEDKAAMPWLKGVVDEVKAATTPEEILKNSQLVPYIDSVFCFTPAGDLVALPLGATALDFAYEIHSSVGNSCAGAKINRVLKSIRTELKTGDEVEIITVKTQHPAPEWERFAVTLKARAAIRRYLKNQKRDEIIAYGKVALMQAFDHFKKPFAQKNLAKAFDRFNVEDEDGLFLLVGTKEASPESVVMSIWPDVPDISKKTAASPSELLSALRKSKTDGGSESRLANIPVYFAKCCYPVPGDPIKGVVHTGRGISVHKAGCKFFLHADFAPEKVFDISWDDCNVFAGGGFRTKISVTTVRRVGALNEITGVLARNSALIEDVKVISTTDGFIEVLFVIFVSSIEHIEHIVGQLKQVKIVNTVLKCS
ncbi:MAG: bifunctional (p)ppGpp synthetase/guanosine-3',5'-bis(diphosphate) 3'-pyrophosphohydrolase [Rickettsiales bacterium]|jgi:GTP pyrophosphokinase|nr:bifunctional (p)ppGpp synthetase/guanosine-3',5'-bis(diphosphate) 3'-pyrophosphohydrolase [Rickettsiales bacterium]